MPNRSDTPAPAPRAIGPALAAAPTVLREAALAGSMDRVTDRAIAEQRTVGAVVLIARAGALIYRGAAGRADRKAARPMTGRQPRETLRTGA